jgi:hypothetical protein
LNTQKITDRDTSIRIRMITHIHNELPTNHPKLTFIPKKLAINVGGMRRRDTRVNTFMILF